MEINCECGYEFKHLENVDVKGKLVCPDCLCIIKYAGTSEIGWGYQWSIETDNYYKNWNRIFKFINNMNSSYLIKKIERDFWEDVEELEIFEGMDELSFHYTQAGCTAIEMYGRTIFLVMKETDWGMSIDFRAKVKADIVEMLRRKQKEIEDRTHIRVPDYASMLKIKIDKWWR